MISNCSTDQKGTSRWWEWEQEKVVSNQFWTKHCPQRLLYVVGLSATSKIGMIILTNFSFWWKVWSSEKLDNVIKLEETKNSNLFQIRCSFCTIPFFFKGLEVEQEGKGIGKEKKNEVDNRYLGHSIHRMYMGHSIHRMYIGHSIQLDGQEKTRNGYCKPKTLFIEIKGKKSQAKGQYSRWYRSYILRYLKITCSYRV